MFIYFKTILCRLHPQRRKIYAGMLVFPPPAMEKVSEFSLEWWKEGQSGKAALMHHMTRGPDGNVRLYHLNIRFVLADRLSYT